MRARAATRPAVVRVHYVLDEAEIPGFQDRRDVAAGPEAFAADRARRIGEGLQLFLDGRPLPLSPVAHRLSQPEGQGGLRTLRLAVTYEAPLPAGTAATTRVGATFADTNEPARLGWRGAAPATRWPWAGRCH